ncbi:MAG TPA: TorF family putative porin [Sphingomicrobium sp.]|nr:TorF family putative porin [Sphingomicrobium sp.]
MKRTHAVLASTLFLSGLALASPAVAQNQTAQSLTVSGGATLVSDYRFRGVSQTGRRFALQGTFGIAHESGFYATVWGSSIDDYVANGSDVEIDLIAGYARDFGGITVDVGATYYAYPGSGGADTDFIEPYMAVSRGFGAVSATLLAAYAPRQDALGIGAGAEDNFYLAGDLSAAVPGTPILLTGHLGHSWGPSYLTIGEEYTDWSLGISAEHKGLTFGLSYVDTDKSAFSPSGRNISKAGIFGSVGVGF